MRFIIANDDLESLSDRIKLEDEAKELKVDPDNFIDHLNDEAGIARLLSRELGEKVETKLTSTGLIIHLSKGRLDRLSNREQERVIKLIRLVTGTIWPISFMPDLERKKASVRRSRTEQLMAEDRELCQDHFPLALKGDSLRGALPTPNADFSLYVDSCIERPDLRTLLPLGSVLYVSMPPSKEKFTQRFDLSIIDFKEAVQARKIIPVFENRLESFEGAYVDEILEVSTAAFQILPGELRLRVVTALNKVEPIVLGIERRTPEAAAILRKIKTLPSPLRGYFEAAEETAKRLRQTFTNLEPIVQATTPLGRFTDLMLREALLREKNITLLPENVVKIIIAHRILLFSHALQSEAVVYTGEPLEPHLSLYFGKISGSGIVNTSDRLQWLLKRIGVLKEEEIFTFGEQALMSRDTQVIEFIRKLTNSDRLKGPDYQQVFKKIEYEEDRLKKWYAFKEKTNLVNSALGLISISMSWKWLESIMNWAGLAEPIWNLQDRLLASSSEARLLFNIHSKISKSPNNHSPI